MQLTPACGYLEGARLPNGHPNLEKDATSPLWTTSVYHPTLNVREGVSAIRRLRQAVTLAHLGCTEAQYTLMAQGAYNRGQASILGCGMMTPAAQLYVASLLAHYQNLASGTGWPNPY